MVAIATVVMAVFTYFLWSTSSDQWKEMVKSNENATRALISTQRAYVNVVGLEIVPLIDATGHQAWWRISPIIQNSGNTPTRNLWMTMLANDYDFNFRKNGPRIPKRDYLLTASKNYATLAPKQETRNWNRQSIPFDWTQGIRDQSFRVYVHGALMYNDFFSDVPHTTQYCYALWGFPPVTGESGFSYSECGGKSNCADEECPQARRSIATLISSSLQSQVGDNLPNLDTKDH